MDTAREEGNKFDGNKPPLSKLPRVSLEEMAVVMAFGASKYGWDNWKKGMDHSRLLNASLRHLYKYADGIDLDDESGLSHLAHAMCNVAFLIYYKDKGIGKDDR
jgi:hypothetical protein